MEVSVLIVACLTCSCRLRLNNELYLYFDAHLAKSAPVSSYYLVALKTVEKCHNRTMRDCWAWCNSLSMTSLSYSKEAMSLRYINAKCAIKLQNT